MVLFFLVLSYKDTSRVRLANVQWQRRSSVKPKQMPSVVSVEGTMAIWLYVCIATCMGCCLTQSVKGE